MITKPPDYPTQRQLQVLLLAAKGLTFQQIADRLGISLYTVKSHAQALHHNLEVHSMAHALYVAIQKGFILRQE